MIRMKPYYIDISDISFEGETKKVQAKLELEPLDIKDVKIETQNVAIDLTFQNIGPDILVSGLLKGFLLLSCSRCLDNFKQPINLSINELFTFGQPDEEKYKIEKNSIDLVPIIQEALITNIPIKALCNEDCKGLCPKCGQNQNVKQCLCKEEPINIRWSKLKELKRKMKNN